MFGLQAGLEERRGERREGGREATVGLEGVLDQMTVSFSPGSSAERE